MTNRKARQHGVAIIEFALILPFLVLLSIVTIEFGRALYQYSTVVKSVRDAARYLTMQTPGTQQAEAANLVVYGNTAGTGTPLARGLTVSHVQAPQWQAAGTNPVMNTVTVRVSGYQFVSMFTTVFGHAFGTFTYSDVTATMRSYL